MQNGIQVKKKCSGLNHWRTCWNNDFAQEKNKVSSVNYSYNQILCFNYRIYICFDKIKLSTNLTVNGSSLFLSNCSKDHFC